VSICHIHTKDVPGLCRGADILISAVGKPGLIRPDMIKNGAVVIDVGIGFAGGRTVGDVDYEGAKEVASLITPVPGGVGPMTITMLLKNTLHLFKAQNQVGL
jgi:methylenetetrahydrofolate dehydrogenase (NADP+)/methenyltetrahydrofolate cyclohydrolase